MRNFNRATVYIFIALCLALGAHLFLLLTLSKDASSLSYRHNKRIEEFFQAKISLKEKKTILVLGQSEIESGFDPIRFDSLTENKYESYNLGSRMASPEFNYLLVKLLKKQLQGKKIPYILYKMPAFSLTPAYKRNYYPGIYGLPLLQTSWEEHPKILFDPLFWQIFTQSLRTDIPGRKHHEILARVLRGSKEKERISNMDRFLEIRDEEEYQDAHWWNPATRGLYKFQVSDEQKKLHEAWNRNPALQMQLARRYESFCNLVSLVPDEDRIQVLQKLVDAMKEISENIIFFHAPEAPGLLRLRTGKNLEILLARTSAMGVSVVDLSQEISFDALDYEDVLHFNERGMEKIYRALAKRIAP